MLVVGSVVGTFSFGFAQMTGLHGMGDVDTKATSPTGLYVASFVGFGAAMGGLWWLMDCNRRRGALNDRIEKLEEQSGGGTATIIPVLNPVTMSSEIAVRGTF